MSNLIVVFPKREVATNIRNILVRGGIDVLGVCQTGAKALQYADTLDEGIVVCGYKMQDMMFHEIREFLPNNFEMLLIASPDKWTEGMYEGVVGLPMPIKVYDLINTIDMMEQTIERRRKKRRKQSGAGRSPEEKAIIDEAKSLLMERNRMDEDEAHRYLQKSSMDSGTNMLETAQMVLAIMRG